MIVRSWSGRAGKGAVQHYVAHARTAVFAHLATITGYRGALVLTQDRAADVGVTVLTFWDTMDAVRAFAGPDPHVAVVEPEADAALIDYDRSVRHFEVAASQAVWPGLFQP